MAWWYWHYASDQSPEDRGRYESAEDEARKEDKNKSMSSDEKTKGPNNYMLFSSTPNNGRGEHGESEEQSFWTPQGIYFYLFFLY